MTVRPVSPKLGGIFKPPPVGQKRFVYLDTRQPKYGFRLERYGHPSELKQEMRVFVQSVSPGSPAFMSGLFPGDTITELNGISVRSDTVAVLVKKIQDRPQQNDKLVHVDRRHCAHTADA
jgi:C-terminal processing protease CtpA/Prc